MASVTIHTTQNVSIEYELASAGSRIAAFLLDLTILILAYLILLFLASQLEWLRNEALFFGFAPVFLLLAYFFFAEMSMQGQTFGKRLIGLRVVRLDGRDPVPADFIARSLFLVVDVLSTFGMLAVLFVSMGGKKQRLGDIVAQTAVISLRGRSEVSLKDVLSIRDRNNHEPEFPGVQQFTDDDMMLVKEALLRRRRYPNSAHQLAVRELAVRMADLLELDKKEVTYGPEDFLERLLLDYIVLTR